MTTTQPPGPAQPATAPPGPGRLLTAGQVAALLGGDISARTVRAYWRTWGLQAYRVGKHLRWRETDVLTWINNHPA
jgi:excisionase family DNA binding protein